MTNDQIVELCERIEGMFPSARVSFTKMQKAWAASAVLQAFPNARRADLLKLVMKNCDDIPTLPLMVKFCNSLVRPERDECERCEGTGYVHVDAAGEPYLMTATLKGSDQVLAYNGTPVLYSFAMPCEACNRTDS